MEIDFNHLLSRDLNQIYQEVKFHQDYPYQTDDLKFLKTYRDLTNFEEIKHFNRLFNRLHDNLIQDAWLYDHQVRAVFLDSYYQFQGTYQQLVTLWKIYQVPLIEFKKTSLQQFQELVKETITTQLGSLNYHFQEFYLTLKLEGEELLNLLTITAPQLVKTPHPELETLINLMQEFNQTQSLFVNQAFRSKIKVNQFQEFKLALKKVCHYFEPLLKVYHHLVLSVGLNSDSLELIDVNN